MKQVGDMVQKLLGGSSEVDERGGSGVGRNPDAAHLPAAHAPARQAPPPPPRRDPPRQIPPPMPLEPREKSAAELHDELRALLLRVDHTLLGATAVAAAEAYGDAPKGARTGWNPSALLSAHWSRASGAQALLLLVYSGFGAPTQPRGAVLNPPPWLASQSERLLLRLDDPDCVAALPQVARSGVGAEALRTTLDALVSHNLRAGSCAWMAALPLLVAEAWAECRAGPPAVFVSPAAAAVRPVPPASASEFRTRAAAACRLLHDAADGDGWCNIGALAESLRVLAKVAPNLGALATLLAQPWPEARAPAAQAQHARVLEAAACARYAALLAAEAAGGRELCAAAPAALDGLRGSAWEVALAPAWSEALLHHLRATAHVPLSRRPALDAELLAAAAGRAMLSAEQATLLLHAAAALGASAPELLPRLLTRTRLSAAAEADAACPAAAAPAAERAAAAAAWLPAAMHYAERRGAPASQSAVAAALAALRLWAAPSGAGGDPDARAALHAEAVAAICRGGLRALLSQLRFVGAAAFEAELALAAVRRLAAAELHSLADISAALHAAAGLPPGGDGGAFTVATPLLRDCALAVLDRVAEQSERDATRELLLGDAPRLWALVARAGGAHGDAVRAHPASSRAALLAAALATALSPGGSMSVSRLGALTDEATRPGLLRLLAAAAPGCDWPAQLEAQHAALATAERCLEACTWFIESAAASGAVDVATQRVALAALRDGWADADVRSLSGDAFWGEPLSRQLRAAVTAVAPLRASALYTALWRRQLHEAQRALAPQPPPPPADGGATFTPASSVESEDGGAGAEGAPQPAAAPPPPPPPQLSLEAVLRTVLPGVTDALAALWCDDDASVGALDTLFGGDRRALVDPDREVDALASYGARQAALQRHGITALARRLRGYAAMSAFLPLAAALAHACETLSVPIGARGAGAALAALAALASSAESRLADVADAVDEAEDALAPFAAADPAVRCLGTPAGRELFGLLQRASEQDMRDLIDAVEDSGADSALRADTVDDAIKVRTALAPVVSGTRDPPLRSADELLAALVPIGRNGVLLDRVANACAHVPALARALSGQTDRTGAARATIAALALRGTYSFAAAERGGGGAHCAASAALGGDQAFDAVALASLHERALLLKRARDAAALLALPDGDGNDGKGGAAASADEQRAAADVFVAHMLLVERIVAAVSALCLRGCVRYRGYAVSVPGAGLAELKAQLCADEATWRDLLDSQRQQHSLLTFFSGPQLWCLSDALLHGDAAAVPAATDLLRFVHRSAAVPALSPAPQRLAPGGAEAHLSASVAWLQRLCDALNAALDAALRQAPAAAADERVVADSPVPRGVACIFACAAAHAVEALAGLFGACGGVLRPARCQLLVCEASTSEEEVASFLQRAETAPSCALFAAALFAVAHVERLSENVHAALVELLEKLQKRATDLAAPPPRWRLALLCDAARRQPLLEEYAEHVVDARGAAWFPRSPAALRALLPDADAMVTITSDHPGLGKSAAAAALAEQHNLRLRSLLMAGDMSRDTIVGRLLALKLRPGDALHVNMADVRDAQTLHCLLYEMTELRAVTGSAAGAAAVAHTHMVERFFVELANPLSGSVALELQRLPLLGAVTRRHCEFRLADIAVPASLEEPMQLVCVYLDLLASNQVDRQSLCGLVDGDELDYLGTRQVRAAALPATRCQELLQAHFFALRPNTEPPTYAALHVFLNALAAQLRPYTLSTGLNYPLIPGEAASSLRSAVLHALLAMARDFAHASVAAARSMQLSSLQLASRGDDVVAFTQRMDAIVRWDQLDTTLMVLSHDGSLIPMRYGRLGASIRSTIQAEYARLGASQLREAASVGSCGDDVLLERLQRMVQPPNSGTTHGLQPGYVLTPDNLLKMSMVFLRLRSFVPVVLMGETGCGKTSLMINLARVMGLLHGPEPRFHVLNFHAGITEEDIVQFVERCEAQALATNKRVVAFLDEVNTCGHLGLLSELLCHSKLLGRPTSRGVAFVAAVNPYRLRVGAAGSRGEAAAGIQRIMASPDPMARLVYRVYPLPEAMLQCIWDFGSVQGDDQKRYLAGMLADLALMRGHVELSVRLVQMSQVFIAKCSAEWGTVSMRDPQRFRTLVMWFKRQLMVREQPAQRAAAAAAATQNNSFNLLDAAAAGISSFVSGLFGAPSGPAPGRQGAAAVPNRRVETPVMGEAEIELRAILLALGHCYHCRLPNATKRAEYMQRVSRTIARFRDEQYSFWHAQHRHGWALYGVSPGDVCNVVMCEQLDYLGRMQLPADTAGNEALRENVFTLLVCILNRMPVFLVGKPGCSKSLAMRLISHNLRGPGSSDAFFRTLPEVRVISFQGSSDSTSAGVLAVFDRAKRFAALPSNALDGPSPVVQCVLLDEVGLAEESINNPLKVLHALLETPDGSPLPYAVVGISNWSLDAAKMSRAVHVARPDPTVDDLLMTALGIAHGRCAAPEAWRLRVITQAYAEFQRERANDPRTRDFHGLRDFYGLVKVLARLATPTDDQVLEAIHRNFSGMIGSAAAFERIVRHNGGLRSHVCAPPRVTELIRGNLRDRDSRHLMLITRGDAAVGLLQSCFEMELRNLVVMVGSRFEDDAASTTYTYNVLSKIIMRMEAGAQLVLANHGRVYGSLYDMLNQSYMSPLAGDRRNCRVALGANANAACNVHADFRCIVVVNADEVDLEDPPFLNRFEKYFVSCADALPPHLALLVPPLRAWMEAAATVLEDDAGTRASSVWKLSDAFAGYGLSVPHKAEEPLAALVLKIALADGAQAAEGGARASFSARLAAADPSRVVLAAKRALLATAPADAVLRVHHSALSRLGGGLADAASLLEERLLAPQHANLTSALRVIAPQERLLVYTLSGYSAVKSYAEAALPGAVMTLQLSAFAGEATLSDALDAFWRPSHTASVLIMQADAFHDASHLALCKHLMEFWETEGRHRAALAAHHAEGVAHTEMRRQVIVVTLHRNVSDEERAVLPFSALSGWTQLMVDDLGGGNDDSELLRSAQAVEQVEWLQARGEDALLEAARAELGWCMRRLHFGPASRAHAAEHARDAARVLGTPEAQHLLQELCDISMESLLNGARQRNSAVHWTTQLACNRHDLLAGGTLAATLAAMPRMLLREPLSRLLYRIVKAGGLASLPAATQGGATSDLGAAMWRCMYLQPREALLADACASVCGFDLAVCRPVGSLLWAPSLKLRAAMNSQAEAQQEAVRSRIKSTGQDEDSAWAAVADTLPQLLLAALAEMGGDSLDALLRCAALLPAAVNAAEPSGDVDERAVQLSVLVAAFETQYVADVLACETFPIDPALAFSLPQLSAAQIKRFLMKALPRAPDAPLRVHVQLWRQRKAFEEVLQLSAKAALEDDVEEFDTVLEHCHACLASAADKHLAALTAAAETDEGVAAWLNDTHELLALGARSFAALGDNSGEPMGAASLRIAADVVSCVRMSLPADMLGVVVSELTAGIGGNTMFSATHALLRKLKVDAAGDAQMLDVLDTCFASTVRRVLENDAAESSDFTDACDAVLGSSWQWGGDDGGGPPLRAALLESLLEAALPDGAESLLLHDGAPSETAAWHLLVRELRRCAGNSDCPLVLLICDVMQRMFAAHVQVSPPDDFTSDCLSRAVAITDAAEGTNEPQYLAALAFLKASLSAAAATLVQPAFLAGPYAAGLAEVINSVLPADGGDDASRERALIIFLVKELERASAGQSAARLCRAESELAARLPCLQGLPWRRVAPSLLEFDLFPAPSCALAEILARAVHTQQPLTLTDEHRLEGPLLQATAVLTLLAARPLDEPQRQRLLSALTGVLPRAPDAAGRLAFAFASQTGGCMPGAPRESAALLGSLMVQLAATVPRTCPLRGYLDGTADLGRDFFLAACGRGPEYGQFASIARQSQFALWQCSCGFYYPVGGGTFGCMDTNESGICPPPCSRPIGNLAGRGHNTPAPGQSRVATITNVQQLDAFFPVLAGFAPDPRSSPESTERGIPPVVFRIMRLLTHLALAARATGNTAAGPTSATALWAAVSADWAALLSLLPSATPMNLCAFLHRILVSHLPTVGSTRLTSAAARDAWEAAFAQALLPLLVDVPSTLVACRTSFTAAETRSVLDEQLAEHGAGHENSWQPRLMRPIALPCFQDVYSQAAEQPPGALPLMRMMLNEDVQSWLHCVSLLWPLVRWTRLVFDAFDSAITRQQAQQRYVDALLAEHEERHPGDLTWRTAYESFARATADLASMRTRDVRFGCKQVPPLDAFAVDGRDVPLESMCITRTGTGALLPALLAFGAGRHNELLAEVARVTGRTTPHRRVRLQELQRRDLLVYDAARAHAALTSFSRPSLLRGAGAGRMLRYDLAAGEAELAVLFATLATVQVADQLADVTSFRFQGEGFHTEGGSNLLPKLRARVPQVPPGDLPESLRRALRTMMEVDVFRLLAALEAAAYCAASAAAPRTEKLLRFGAAWLSAEHQAALHVVPPLRLAELQHLEALYFTAEGLVADALFDTADGDMKTELPPGAADELRALCGTPLVDAAPPAEAPRAAAECAAFARALADVLRRFVARYLAGEADIRNGDAPVAGVYTDLLPWPPGAQEMARRVEDAFPPSVLVRHVYSAKLFLSNLEREMDARAVRRAAPEARQAATGAAAPGGGAAAPRRVASRPKAGRYFMDE